MGAQRARVQNPLQAAVHAMLKQLQEACSTIATRETLGPCLIQSRMAEKQFCGDAGAHMRAGGGAPDGGTVAAGLQRGRERGR